MEYLQDKKIIKLIDNNGQLIAISMYTYGMNEDDVELFLSAKQEKYKESHNSQEVEELGNREDKIWSKVDIESRNEAIEQAEYLTAEQPISKYSTKEQLIPKYSTAEQAEYSTTEQPSDNHDNLDMNECKQNVDEQNEPITIIDCSDIQGCDLYCTTEAENEIIKRLKTIPGVKGVQAATETNDPNGGLNKPGKYVSAIYFELENVD